MKAYLRMIYCSFLQIIREPIIIIVYIGFPIIFVFLFGMAFSQENQSFSVGIVEAEDEPAVIEAFSSQQSQDVFNITYGSLEKQLDLLENKKLDFIIDGTKTQKDEKMAIYYRDKNNLTLIQLMMDTMYYNQLEIPKLDIEYTNISGETDAKAIDQILPGVLAITLMQLGLFGALNLAKLKENKTLRAYGVTPVTKRTIIISELIVKLCVCLIQGLIVIGLGALIFDLNVYFGNTHLIILWILLGGATFISLGYMFVALFHSFEATNGVIQIVQMGMMFLSGVFIPITILPKAVQGVIHCNPVAYLSDALSAVITNTGSYYGYLTDFIFLFVMMVISTSIATRIRWD